MHPVKIPMPSQTDPSFLFPQAPPHVHSQGARNERGSRPPLQLIPFRVKIHGNPPAMSGVFRAPAHFPHVQAAAPQVQAQPFNLFCPVMIKHPGKHPLKAVLNFFVALKSVNYRSLLPGQLKRIGQVNRSLVFAHFPIEPEKVFLRCLFRPPVRVFIGQILGAPDLRFTAVYKNPPKRAKGEACLGGPSSRPHLPFQYRFPLPASE